MDDFFLPSMKNSQCLFSASSVLVSTQMRSGGRTVLQLKLLVSAMIFTKVASTDINQISI